MNLIRKKAYKRINNEDRHPKKMVDADTIIPITWNRNGMVIDLERYRQVNKRRITLEFYIEYYPRITKRNKNF